jgi:hypothetical protein
MEVISELRREVKDPKKLIQMSDDKVHGPTYPALVTIWSLHSVLLSNIRASSPVVNGTPSSNSLVKTFAKSSKYTS